MNLFSNTFYQQDKFLRHLIIYNLLIKGNSIQNQKQKTSIHFNED